MSQPSLAIIIVTYNDTDSIVHCLEQVSRYTDPAQVIVIDNQSKDGTCALIRERFPHVRLIENNANVGFGTANNQVMRLVQADFYFLLNSDAYLTDASTLPDALAYLRAHPDVGIAGIPLIFPDGSTQGAGYAFSSPQKWTLQVLGVNDALRWLLQHDRMPLWVRKLLAKMPMGKAFVHVHQTDKQPALDVDWICGAAMLISRPCFEATQGFDENIFLYGEDEDICIRARDAGFRRVLLAVAPVGHEMGARTHRKAYHPLKLGGMRYFVDKHFSPWPLRLLMQGLLRLKLFKERR